ncbi:MAG: winged helix-turn-helix domain-containing protein [Dysgonomonas sp.]
MLKEIIETDAVLIKEILSGDGIVSAEYIQKKTNYRRAYVHLVLGWLYKENEISFLERDDDLYIQLNL